MKGRVTTVIGVVPHYRALYKRLEKQKNRIAPLQLLGRIEDLLTKEFATSILERSRCSTVPILNVGDSKDGRRIDVALISGDISKGVVKTKLRIWGFVELKYLRNKHRIGEASSADENEPTFKSLHRQLVRLDTNSFAGYSVRLRGGKRDTYGLVFASYVARKPDPDKQERFLKAIVGSAKKHGFVTYNFKPPKLRSVYTNLPVTILHGKYMVSLYCGLWRLDERPSSTCECLVEERC